MPAPAFITSILSQFPLVEYPEEPCYSLSASSSTAAPYSSSAPEHPTFWLYGPGVNNERESFDVECLRLQAEAVFAGIETRTRWLDTAEGAPGGASCPHRLAAPGNDCSRLRGRKAGEASADAFSALQSCSLSSCELAATLPALHLPNGDLLPAGAISAWIAKNGPNAAGSQYEQAKEKEKDGYTVDGENKAADAGPEIKTDQQENVSLQARTYTSLVESKLQPALVRPPSLSRPRQRQGQT